MFLTEIEEILDRVQSHHLQDSQVPLFTQIAKSINSPHFQVSERAIYLLNNDVILRFITNNREQLVPVLSKALYSNTFLTNPPADETGGNEWMKSMKWQEKGHWNPTIVELTQDILKLFDEMDAGLMTKCSDLVESSAQKQVMDRRKRDAAWRMLDGMHGVSAH